MKASDVMVTPAISVKDYFSVREVARVLLDRQISAVPVIHENGSVVGIVSEGDLLRRPEERSDRQRPRWLEALVGDDTLAADFAKARNRRVADIMTRDVVTATPDTPLDEIASLMETSMIKHVPIVESGRLAGIVSRANLVQALAGGDAESDVAPSDTLLRDELISELTAHQWPHTSLLNITVAAGVVDLWGKTESGAEKQAIHVAVEKTPGVRALNDNLILRRTPPAEIAAE